MARRSTAGGSARTSAPPASCARCSPERRRTSSFSTATSSRARTHSGRNASDYVHQIVSPLVDGRVPWASTYGNHDSKFNLSREATFEIEASYPLSYTQRMGSGLPGITNYYLLLHLPTTGQPVCICGSLTAAVALPSNTALPTKTTSRTGLPLRRSPGSGRLRQS